MCNKEIKAKCFFFYKYGPVIILNIFNNMEVLGGPSIIRLYFVVTINMFYNQRSLNKFCYIEKPIITYFKGSSGDLMLNTIIPKL